MAKKSSRGGVREGAGRKPKGDRPFDDRLMFDCMSEDKAAWLAKSTETGIPLSEVIRRYLNRWVRK